MLTRQEMLQKLEEDKALFTRFLTEITGFRELTVTHSQSDSGPSGSVLCAGFKTPDVAGEAEVTVMAVPMNDRFARDHYSASRLLWAEKDDVTLLDVWLVDDGWPENAPDHFTTIPQEQETGILFDKYREIYVRTPAESVQKLFTD